MLDQLVDEMGIVATHCWSDRLWWRYYHLCEREISVAARWIVVSLDLLVHVAQVDSHWSCRRCHQWLGGLLGRERVWRHLLGHFAHIVEETWHLLGWELLAWMMVLRGSKRARRTDNDICPTLEIHLLILLLLLALYELHWVAELLLRRRVSSTVDTACSATLLRIHTEAGGKVVRDLKHLIIGLILLLLSRLRRVNHGIHGLVSSADFLRVLSSDDLLL